MSRSFPGANVFFQPGVGSASPCGAERPGHLFSLSEATPKSSRWKLNPPFTDPQLCLLGSVQMRLRWAASPFDTAPITPRVSERGGL